MIDNSLWKNHVGVLPVNFLHSQPEDQRIYAMLNGWLDYTLDYLNGQFMNLFKHMSV